MDVSAGVAAPAPPRRFAAVAAPGLREPLFVWALHGVFLALTFATYTRIAPDDLYHVSRGGLAGGAGRTLVELNFPVALAAIPLLGLCAARLRRRVAGGLAALGVALCALVVVTVDQDDLDARAVNALPATGVVIAVALTVWALREGGLGGSHDRLPGDVPRLLLGVATLLVSIPWLFAEAGFYAPDPVYADEIVPGPGEPALAAVHLGSHHGTEGAVLLVTALVLSRLLPSVRGRLAGWTSASVALMLAYGTAIAAEDFWHEQVVKRGAVEWRLPNMTLPSIGWGWLGIVIAAAAIELLWFRRERTPR